MAYRYRDQAAQTNVASVINILAGLWLIASPWIYAGSRAVQGLPGGAAPIGAWNSVIVGIVVALFAVIRLSSGAATAPLSWVNAALGAWMIAAPWVIGYAGDPVRTWNSVIVGIIVLIMAIISATAGEAVSEGEWGYREGPWSWGYPPYGYAPYGSPWSRPWGYGEGAEHRGRGPRGYRRSDEQIRNDVCDRMWEHPRLDASDIDVRVEDSEVILEGHVASREAKREAEAVAEGVPGVLDVRNDLRVRRGLSDREARRVA